MVVKDTPGSRSELIQVQQKLRRWWGAIVRDLTPLKMIGAGWMIVAHQGRSRLWHATRPLHEQPFTDLGTAGAAIPDVALIEALDAAQMYAEAAARWQTASLDAFRAHVDDFLARPDPHSHLMRNTLPAADRWRPIRHCIDDRAVGLCCYRFDRRAATVAVDAFITADYEAVEAASGTRALLQLLCCEAFLAGGQLAIAFQPPPGIDSSAAVPPDVGVFLKLAGIAVAEDLATIGSESTRELMLSLSGLEGAAREAIGLLHKSGDISIERLCFLALTGVWPVADLQAILLNCPEPGRLLNRAVDTADRGQMSIMLAHARSAVLLTWACTLVLSIAESQSVTAVETQQPRQAPAYSALVRVDAPLTLPNGLTLTPEAPWLFSVVSIHMMAVPAPALGLEERQIFIVPADARRAVTSARWERITSAAAARLLVSELDLEGIDLELLDRLERGRKVAS